MAPLILNLLWNVWAVDDALNDTQASGLYHRRVTVSNS